MRVRPEFQQFQLAAGQVARGFVGQAGQVEEIEHLHGLVPVFLLLAPDAPRADQVVPELFAKLTQWRQHDVLEHRKRTKRARNLEGAGNTGPVDLVRRLALNGLPFEMDGPGGWRIRAGDGVEQGGLARAIGPDQAGDGAAGQAEADIVDGAQAAKRLRNPLQFEHPYPLPV
jgi:hypothetical protein